MLEKRGLNDPDLRDVNDGKFFEALRQTLRETKEELLRTVAEQGIELDDPKLVEEVTEHEETVDRLVAQHEPFLQKAHAYLVFVSDILERANSDSDQQGQRMTEKPPFEDQAAIVEALEVISYYHAFIYIKLRRAIHSTVEEELETDQAIRELSSDADGSAKVALIAIDRSWLAWGSLLNHLEEGDETVRDALAQLSALREATELIFPAARGFIRPGFDEQPI
jgi:hypothetical protein